MPGAAKKAKQNAVQVLSKGPTRPDLDSPQTKAEAPDKSPKLNQEASEKKTQLSSAKLPDETKTGEQQGVLSRHRELKVDSPKSADQPSSPVDGSGKVKISSSSRPPSRPDSPKWPQPGGGGWGERAWTREVVWCRSHGAARLVRPRVIRDLSPKRKEWEAQFPQPVFDLHCEFHGNATREYIQRELKRCSPIRSSGADSSPRRGHRESLEAFLKEKREKTERSLSNQKERDRKSLAIIHNLEKENLEKKKQEDKKDETIRSVAILNTQRKVLKGTRVTAEAVTAKASRERDGSRFRDPSAPTAKKVEKQTILPLDNSALTDLQHEQIDLQVQSKRAGGTATHHHKETIKHGSPEDRFSEDLKEHNIAQEASGPAKHALESQPAAAAETAPQLADDHRPPTASFPATSDQKSPSFPPFTQYYHWILLPQHFGPAPSHYEDPLTDASCCPWQPGSTPESTAAYPAFRSLETPLGYHDTYILRPFEFVEA